MNDDIFQDFTVEKKAQIEEHDYDYRILKKEEDDKKKNEVKVNKNNEGNEV